MVQGRLPGLHWGIKASFLDYVSRMPDGRGTVGSGAVPTDDNVIVFEPAPDVREAGPDKSDLFLAFRGDVRFAGHHGMLYVRIADPWIIMSGSLAQLSVLDPYQPDEAPRLPLAQLTLTPLRVSDAADAAGPAWHSADVRLTAEGTKLFNDVYPPGELFEPLSIFPTSTATREGSR